MTVRHALFSAALIAATWGIAPGQLDAQGLPAGTPADLGMSSERLDRIGKLLQAYVDQGKTPGVVAVVARRGRVVWSGAVGMSDREADRKMTPDALFRIASQSKAVTSVAAMILVEEGKLRLNDRVSKFIPSFDSVMVAVRTDSGRILVAAEHAVTIRNLLTQTAGLSYGTDALVREDYRAVGLGPAAGYGWYLADKAESICTTMDRIGDLPFVAQPGEAWIYGYASDVLGCVVERAAGVPLDQFIREQIFLPLKMNHTWFFPPDSVSRLMTAVYAVTEEGTLLRAPDGPMGQGDYLSGPRRDFSGGAGLVSTAGDYLRFLEMLRNGGEIDGVRILSPVTVSLMTADQVDSLYGRRGMGFGLGFEILENPGLAGQFGAPGRFGWAGAYATNYWVDPSEGLTVVLMQQLLPARGLDLADKFRTMVYAALVSTSRSQGQ